MTAVGITGAMATMWLSYATDAGLVLLLLGALLTLWRAAWGPLASDRVIALLHSWLIGIGLITLLALRSHSWRELDLALALALLGGMVPLAWSWANRNAANERQANSNDEAPHVDTHCFGPGHPCDCGVATPQSQGWPGPNQ